MNPIFGGIEAGGTKFNCIVAENPEKIIAEARFNTITPSKTLEPVLDFFRAFPSICSIGIAGFGPLDLNPDSATYGYITSTPKPDWGNTNLRGIIRDELKIPVNIDTDVNAAAIAEGKWGSCQGLKNFVYFTIGTGIGGGAVINGSPLHGLVHPEMGHLLLPHDLARDPFTGVCPYHQDCFEGLACGPAISKRWGIKAEKLPADHPAWELEAHYIALALQTIICTLSPEKIVLGGGVMQQAHLFPKIRQKTTANLNKYIQSPLIIEQNDRYILPPGLGSRAGAFGAIALAQMAI